MKPFAEFPAESFDRLVVGVDLSPFDGAPTPGSRRALEDALGLARRTGSRLAIVHASPCAWAEDFCRCSGRQAPCTEDLAAGALARLAEEARGAGVRCETLASVEPPWLALAAQVLEEGADLTVVGKHEAAWTDPCKLGSLPRVLLRSGLGPVWLSDPARRTLPRRVLALAGPSPMGRACARWATFVAGRCGSSLDIVLAPAAREAGQDLEPAARGDLREALRRELARYGNEVDARLVEPTSPGVEGALEFIHRLRPDLAVLGAGLRPARLGAALDQATERTLASLPCSILALTPAPALAAQG